MNETKEITLSTKLLKLRHQQAFKELREHSNPVIVRLGINKAATIVGEVLNVSGQTVINYLASPGKDGFLTEAITREFKLLKYKPNY